MGNFLYGANARAMGFTESGILRGAAFYQPIGDNGWSSVPEGIYNFITNSGDNPGDPEQTLRGIRYHDEVFMNNQTDSSSTSCLDLITVSQGDTSSPGSGGGSGDTGGGTGGGTGQIIKYGCEIWKFPDGNGGYYYMEKNCKYMTIP